MSVTAYAQPGANTRYTSAYTPNETHWISRSKYAQSGTLARAVMEVHGYGLTADNYFGNGVMRPTGVAGFPTIVADYGGSGQTNGTGWGNDGTQSALGGAIGWALAQPDIKSDKVFLYGESMGTLASLNYLIGNASKVKAVAISLPAVNLQDLHDNRNLPGGGACAAPIESAYGGASGYASALSTHNPYANLTSIANTGVPILLCYSATDAIALPAYVTGMATTLGAQATLYSIPNASGHDASNLDLNVITSFFASHDS